MRTKSILLKIICGLGVAAALVVLVGWLAFVPSPTEPPYEFVMAWGKPGGEIGHFSDPIGVAVGADEVFVADSRNSRIQVFDLNGRFRRQFGAPGKEMGQLGRPMNLVIHGGELYVAEYLNDRIQVFGLDGTPRRTIGRKGDGPGEFNSPGGVAVAPDGDLFVADFYNQRVQQLRSNGRFVRQWGTTGRVGFGPGEFNYPTDVALGPDGTLYVADGYNDRIQAFDLDGGLRRKWGGPFAMNIFGPFNGWFATVTRVTVDNSGNVYVADFYNHRVQKFAADGRFLVSLGRKGKGPGELDHPTAVAVARDGTLFVADFGNNRIQQWRPGR